MTDPLRQHHDMGGLDLGPIKPTDHELEPWQKRIEAMVRLLSMRDPPIVTVDEMRRGIEELPPETYDSLSYFERWIASLSALLLEKGILDRAELDARLAEIARRREAST